MKPCFVIAHRYYRTYESYIKYYVDNIQSFYPDSLVIIVDNKSKYIQDIKDIFQSYSNVIILINETDCLFEIGAYKVGINYILQNNLHYEYIVFSQDNMVLKNKLDFNTINDKAFPIGAIPGHRMYYSHPIIRLIAEDLGISLHNPDIDICWCCSFILHYSKVSEFYKIVKDIVITVRYESELSERYLSAIMYYLNGYKAFSLIENVDKLDYNIYTVDIYTTKTKNYFVKRIQNKTEKTID